MAATFRTCCALLVTVIVLPGTLVDAVLAQSRVGPVLLPEQRCIVTGHAIPGPRDPRAVRSEAPIPVRLPDAPEAARPQRLLSLEEAIFIAVQNCEVVRVASGDGAISTGRTIYDPAIVNTLVDRARSRFDPALSVDNTFLHEDQPGVVGTGTPPFARFTDNPIDSYQFTTGVTKPTLVGGFAGLHVNANPSRSPDPTWPLSPHAPSSLEFSYSQPLLRDAGRGPNLALITIRVYETEQSFYDFKGAVQQLVRSTIELYWALVAARIDVWTREQQIESAHWAVVLAEAQLKRGLGDAGELAQARVTLANLRAQRIAAQATVLDREQALRNLLGWPPTGPEELVPVTAPTVAPLGWQWDDVVTTAIENRPDLAGQRLALRIVEEELLLARNQTLPDVRVNTAYRFNDLAGRTADDTWIETPAGRHTSWRLGLDLQVPLGQRDSRAVLREKELGLARDRAHYRENLHQVTHALARIYRGMETSLLEYEAFEETRAAAETNVAVQQSRWRANFAIYLNVLQAIASWGDAVAAESRAVLRYNTEIAQLQEQMGVILEEHGIVLDNQYFLSLGPAGPLGRQRTYPRNILPRAEEAVTEPGLDPSEHWFHLDGLDIPTLELPQRPPQPEPLPIPGPTAP